MIRRALTGERVPFVLTVLAVWTLLRIVTTTILLWVTYAEQDPSVFTGTQPPFFDVAILWDGKWYQRIAVEGYPGELPVDAAGDVQQNPWAFYPVFPLTVRLLMGGTGLPFGVAATAVATVLGYAAALAIAGLLRHLVGAPGALAAVALVGAFPAAPTLQVAYTESLALLLLATVLWLLVRRRWLPAAGVALLTGLARPIALPLGLVALVAVLVRWRSRHEEPISRGEGLGMVSALAACAASGLIWPAVAWVRTGRPDAYTVTMSAWRQGEPITPFVPTVEVTQLLFGDLRGPLLLLGAGGLLVLAVAGPWARGLGVELRTWCLAYPLYLAAALDPWTSIYRYLLPLFPLFVLLVGAGWARDDRRGRQPGWLLGVRTAVLVTLFVGWQVWWTWELFRFVPPSDFPP
ncbi:hypothetical protein [Ornithinimicrobium sediminis]|uniref:hypothetical protein n=1 Tax=Ornithinimicrobium sediminis TaxID=2904603 RepID=UPI001E558149|nr:hypothetical protein [Ornithinimicrobium sediminis]MCE0486294.1 hypothetical protein [Ornithinimicrobium sediminis]